ncbi:DUF1631 domain-containing protein [Leeia aquatica]|uniref:DUF1631 domain-containing protein n=1 Tax=Leeia aquatica TaxID=2725557 RepID=A0A847S4W8_9NEIS|nr:DUF1631 domain-containing protein [Leeia aquatica]NLR76791.1 DUF1631 domain-containing protein [Leeia aquatica]
MSASTKPANVISISEFDDRQSANGVDSRRLLQECRDLALTTLSRSLSSMMDKIEDVLFDLAEKSHDRERSNLYMNARGLTSTNRATLEASFRQQFMEAFDAAILNPKGQSAKMNELDWGSLELSLVDNKDYEESLAVKNIATKLRSNCNEELSALDQRLGVLLSSPELEDESSPLSPHRICEAFGSACDSLQAELDVKLIILKLFEQMVSGDVRSMYHELNSFLIARNVLPKIPLAVRRRNAANQGFNPEQARAAEQEQPQAASAADAAALNPEQVEQGLMALLQQMVQHGRAQLPMSLGGAAMPVSNAGASVLPVLERLQQGEMPDGVHFRSNIDWTSLETLGAPNVLRALKEDVLDGQASQVETLTIDIVSMLFDYIFEQRNIPAEIKALLGRLQIPVLKVALLDAKFFSRKQHPARRLLDALAQSSLGWSAEAEGGDRFKAMVERIVQTIVTEFTDDVGLFETQEAVLQQFLAEEERLAAELAQQSARVLFAQEQLEVARGMVEAELRQRVQKADVPAVVRDFLAKYWGGAMIDAYQQGGVNGAPWAETLQTMDDLIWSCEPKTSTEERMRLVGLLQPMLKRLETVMDSKETPKEEKERFLAEMVRCHSAAIKAGMKPDTAGPQIRQPVPDVNIELPPVPEMPVQHELQPVDVLLTDLVPEHLEPLPEVEQPLVPADVAAADRYLWTVAQMKRGTWVDFMADDGMVTRAKLAWISPHKGMYLFTNRFGGNAMSIPREALAAKMRAGKVELVDDSALLDRAVSAVMDRLQQDAAPTA